MGTHARVYLYLYMHCNAAPGIDPGYPVPVLGDSMRVSSSAPAKLQGQCCKVPRPGSRPPGHVCLCGFSPASGFMQSLFRVPVKPVQVQLPCSCSSCRGSVARFRSAHQKKQHCQVYTHAASSRHSLTQKQIAQKNDRRSIPDNRQRESERPG